MRGGDPLAGHVGELLVHELRRVGAALADQVGVEPLLGDALELAEEVELGLLAGVAPLRVEQALREVEERPWRAACRSRCSRFRSTPSPMMPGVPRDRRADEVGRELEDRVVVELGASAAPPAARRGSPATRGKRISSASRSGRTAFTWIVSRGGCGGATTGLAVKSNGMPRTSAYSTLNRPVLVQLVRLAAQRAADDLLAEELGAEGADAEDVGDGVRVPALGEHRDGDDAADGAAELARLADRVHDLAQQLLVGEVRRPARASPVRSTISRRKRSISSAAMSRKLSSSASPDFELLAVDEQRVRARQRVAVSRRSCGRARGARSRASWCRPRSSGGSRRCSRRRASRSPCSGRR